jgi:hypothetical protein
MTSRRLRLCIREPDKQTVREHEMLVHHAGPVRLGVMKFDHERATEQEVQALYEVGKVLLPKGVDVFAVIEKGTELELSEADESLASEIILNLVAAIVATRADDLECKCRGRISADVKADDRCPHERMADALRGAGMTRGRLDEIASQVERLR